MCLYFLFHIVYFVFFFLFLLLCFFFFFFNDTATTEIYTLSLHDALPILNLAAGAAAVVAVDAVVNALCPNRVHHRSEEHTSELQSRGHLVCRLLLEKKKKKIINHAARSEKKDQWHTVDRTDQRESSYIDV